MTSSDLQVGPGTEAAGPPTRSAEAASPGAATAETPTAETPTAKTPTAKTPTAKTSTAETPTRGTATADSGKRRAPSGTGKPRRRGRDDGTRRARLVAVAVGLVALVAVSLVVRSALPHHPSGARAKEAADAAADVNALARTLADDEQTLEQCPPLGGTGGLTCAASQDHHMAVALARFEQTVAALRLPGDARSADARLERDTGRLVQDLDALATSSSASQYQTVASTSAMAPLGRAVDGDALALVARIKG